MLQRDFKEDVAERKSKAVENSNQLTTAICFCCHLPATQNPF